MADDFSYDVFLSHSSKDKAIVRAVAERLRADGLRVWFDDWELRPGDHVQAKIDEGLEHSRVLVLCMSAHAFSSDWALLEASTFRFRDPLNKERRLIPLRLDDAPIKGSLEPFLYIDWLPDNREQSYAKLLEACHPRTRRPLVGIQAAGEKVAEESVQLYNEADLIACALSPSPDRKRATATRSKTGSTYRKSAPFDRSGLEHRLRKELQQKIASVAQMSSLPELCETVEQTIVDHLGTVLLEEFSRLAAAGGLECKRLTDSRVAFSGRRLELRVTQSEPIVVIAFVEIALDAIQPRTTIYRADVRGSGRFREMHLVMDSFLEPWQCALAEVATRILEAGARWLEQHVRSELNKLTQDVASELYRIVREILPEKVAAEVWLFALTKNKGIYLSDQIRRERALDRVLTRRVVSKASPIKQLAVLTTQVLESKTLFAGKILGQGGSLEVDISRAKYDSDFEIAEEAVYHTKRLAGQPLVKEGDSRLIAGYPAHLRPEVEVVLARERRRFRDTLAESALPLWQLRGEFFGGMIKELASVHELGGR